MRVWNGARNLLAGALAVGLAGALIAATPLPANAALPAGGMSGAALTATFTAYGNTSGEWTGGDSTVSIPLPDGRDAWLFSDTILGTVNPDGSRPVGSPFIHNSVVIQDGSSLVDTRFGGTTAAPTSLVAPASGTDQYWAGDGTIEGSTMRVLYMRMRPTGLGPLDFALVDTALVTFALPGLTVQAITDLGLGTAISWGSSLLEAGGYTYIYGSEYADGLHFAHLARVSAGGLGGAWEFWTGTAWSSSSTASARLLSGVGTGFGVQAVGSQYVLVTQQTNLLFSPDIVAYTATSPTGPFTGPIPLFTAPEPNPSSAVIVYDARLHPELAQSGKLLVSYNANSLESGEIYSNASIYRPRFVDVDWPRPVPNPATLPAAPTGLAATADPTGTVHLTWMAPAGTGLTYNVYQRDVTAGQTHVARLSTGVAEPGIDLRAFYKTGHTYEFSVSARNATGEGPPTATASTTVTIAAPPAPTGVTATTAGDGTITLTWNPVPYVWRYDVYRRDVTLGEAEFARQYDGNPNDTTFVSTGLEPSHQYAFQVMAIHGGGQSPPSTAVTATAVYSLPTAPTALTATAQTNGTITLAWTATGTNVWYNVYQRDVTGGESTFTKWPLPVTSGTTALAQYLKHAHLYEFRLAAINKGGESAYSNTASATASYAIPAAPAGLTATAQSDGSIALAWTAPGPDLWYRVYQRDVTAGEATFTPWGLPITGGPSATARYLVHGHQYEYKVSATSAGGESPLSNVANATASYALPAAPTNPQATPGDGQVGLTWSAAPDSWFYVYMRDVTAGDTAFARLGLPITSCCTVTLNHLTNSHQYEFKVAGTNSGGEGPASPVVAATPQAPPPGSPTGLTATARSDGAITLAWTAPGPNVWYKVYQRDVTAGQTAFTAWPLPIQGGTTALATNLSNNHTYEFKVAATNSIGESAASNAASATATYPLPPAPTNLRGQSSGSGAIDFAWDPPAGPSVLYWIYYRDVTAGQATFTKTSVPTSQTSARWTMLLDQHTYEFKVTADSPGGEGPASNTISVMARGWPPDPPSGLVASAGDGQVTLTWTASPTAGVWYLVYQRDVTAGEVGFTKFSIPVTTCCSLVAHLLTNGHTYEYKVTATTSYGDSTASNVASARPLPPLPAAPSGLSATVDDGRTVLTWTASPTAGVWYAVFMRDATAGQDWRETAVPVTTCCTVPIEGLTSGHQYEFKVAATNVAGYSPTSNVYSVTPMPPLPQAPSGLTAAPGDGKVTLSWTASPTANVWYQIEYKLSTSSTWTTMQYPITTCCTNTMVYLTNGAAYNFRVRATNVAGVSGPTDTATATPAPPTPQAPSGLSATAGDMQVALSWTASPTPNSWYLIDYKPSSATTWTTMQYPITTCCTNTMVYLNNGTSYDFRIRATTAGGASAPSNTVSATPMPPVPEAPTGLTALSPLAGYVTLTWNASPTPRVFYRIYYRMAGDLPWTQAWLPASTNAVTMVDAFNNNELYEFQVSAYNIAGESPRGNVANTVVKAQTYLYTHSRNGTNGSNSIGSSNSDGHTCEYTTAGQTVCFDITENPIVPGAAMDHPMTVGDYLLFNSTMAAYDTRLRCEADKRANIRLTWGRQFADQYGPDLARHEEIHSVQWAEYKSAATYILQYSAASVASWAQTGNYFEANRFEIEASLYWGGYTRWWSDRYYDAGGILCNRYYIYT